MCAHLAAPSPCTQNGPAAIVVLKKVRGQYPTAGGAPICSGRDFPATRPLCKKFSPEILGPSGRPCPVGSGAISFKELAREAYRARRQRRLKDGRGADGENAVSEYCSHF